MFAVANHGPGSDLPSHGEQTFSTSCYMIAYAEYQLHNTGPGSHRWIMKNIDVMIYLKKPK